MNLKTIVIELTNHCNLRCLHCFDQRHGASGYLPVDIVTKVLHDASASGYNHISFTGGEPTLHPQFSEILKLVHQEEYSFGFVSNGWTFPTIYEKLLPYRQSLSAITFSMDGDDEETHDHPRGKGSYKRLITAINICTANGIPFTVNSIITARNLHRTDKLAERVMELGSRGLRFCHLLPSSQSIRENLVPTSEQRKEAENSIHELEKNTSMPVVLAPGYYTTDLIPCNPLKLKEITVDWQGNVTFCCNLSGQKSFEKRDVIGSLHDMTFSEAILRLNEMNNYFLKTKFAQYAQGLLSESDYFPCRYCIKYFNNPALVTEHFENDRPTNN